MVTIIETTSQTGKFFLIVFILLLYVILPTKSKKRKEEEKKRLQNTRLLTSPSFIKTSYNVFPEKLYC